MWRRLVVLAAALAACRSEPRGGDAAATSAHATATSPAAAPAPAERPSPSATAAVPPAGMATAYPTAVPGRAPPPTDDEWAKVREVRVHGSTRLGCETKVLGGWFRARCRATPERERPSRIRVVAGGTPGEVFTVLDRDATALLVPLAAGSHIEAAFTWRPGQVNVLVLDWPLGRPRPDDVGGFRATPEMDRAEQRSFVCGCMMEDPRTPPCDDEAYASFFSAECYRTYLTDCACYKACVHFSSDCTPKCLPGESHTMYYRCARDCDASRPCPAGETCETDLAFGSHCVGE